MGGAAALSADRATAATPRSRWPWGTAAWLAAATGAALWPGAEQALGWSRERILGGEIWRLWSGHAVHFGWAHLGWNLALLGLAGVWLERLRSRAAGWFWLLGPGVIGAALLVLAPGLREYGGLSGLATAAWTWLALEKMRGAAGGERRFWQAVLGLVALKVGLELAGQVPGFAGFAGTAVRTEPMAHLAGAGLGVLAYLIRDRAEGSVTGGADSEKKPGP